MVIQWTRLVLAVLVCEAIGLLGSLFTRSAIPTWYATLAKPWFTPPSWLFGPVWTLLYLLMGIAAYLVWQRVGPIHPAMLAFLGQLVLNGLWSPLFFGLRSPLLGLVDIVALLVALVVTIALFWRVDWRAGALLVPYWAWVAYATALNYGIWRLNP